MTDTINIPRAELRGALRQLSFIRSYFHLNEYASAILEEQIEAFRARLAKPEKEQDPVAWGVMKRGERVYYVNDSRNVCQGYAELYGHRSGYGTGKLDHEVIPLYTAPPQREWQGLPESSFAGMTLQQVSAMKYAEMLLKEKNGETL